MEVVGFRQGFAGVDIDLMIAESLGAMPLRQPAAAQHVKIAHRHGDERHAGRGHRNAVVLEPDFARLQHQCRGDHILVAKGHQRVGQFRNVELGPRLVAIERDAGTDGADLLFEDDQPLTHIRGGEPLEPEQHRGADGGMAGEWQLLAGREDAHPRGVGGLVRRQHEHRFRQVELLGDPLHGVARQPVAIEHDRKRVAAHPGVGEDVKQGVAARHGVVRAWGG